MKTLAALTVLATLVAGPAAYACSGAKSAEASSATIITTADGSATTAVQSPAPATAN